MVLTVSFGLSLVTGLSCHHRRRIISADLTPASGRQDHTTSPSAFAPLVLRRQSVHRIRHPTFVTIRETPLFEGRGTGRACKDDLPDGESEIFFSRGLDGRISVDRKREIRRLAKTPKAW